MFFTKSGLFRRVPAEIRESSRVSHQTHYLYSILRRDSFLMIVIYRNTYNRGISLCRFVCVRVYVLRVCVCVYVCVHELALRSTKIN